MSHLKEILPNIFRWSEFSEEKQLSFNGHLIIHQGESVLIDPPNLSDEDLNKIKALVSQDGNQTLKAILLTNVHHDRNSITLKKLLSVPICIHENDASSLDFTPDKTFKGGEKIFCGLQTISLTDQKSPGETAFFLEAQNLLIVGDALIGKVPGKVNLLPADKYKDQNKAKEGLAVLLNHNFDKLLVGDGEPILENAKTLVEVFLTS